MKKLPLIAILCAVLNVASASTPVIEAPVCDSKLSPQSCAVQDAGPKQEDTALVAPPAAAKHSRHDEAAQPVPEPQTFAMILIGLVLLGFTSRRQEAYEKFSD